MSESVERRRILVVDDEERMVRFIRMNLEHDGFQVSEAFNGKQAIKNCAMSRLILFCWMLVCHGSTVLSWRKC